MHLSDIAPGDRGWVSPDHLVLDSHNPRFAGTEEEEGVSQLEAVAQLLEFADLEELVQSIAANCYINIEPLIVVREPDSYRVIEGNRRVAAVKLLLNPDWARELDVNMPYLTDEALASLEQLEVLVVANRNEARQYIGFKHINGPHKWDSLAKGRFAAEWFVSERAYGTTLRDIARRLGDRHDTVLRLVHGIFVLDQAEAAGIFRVSRRYPGRTFAFSHLYTALTRPGYRKFLGLDPNWRQVDPEPDPVPQERWDNLGRVLTWLYGSRADDQPPVITSQNPHIKQLGEVLENSVATATLELTADLRKAHAEVDTPTRKFTEALLTALQSAERAQQNVYDVTDVDLSLLEIARRLAKVSAAIHFQLSNSGDTNPYVV